MMTALLSAMAGLKVYAAYMEKKVAEEALRAQKSEVMARNAKAQARVAEMESEILVMSQDTDSLQVFIDRAASGEDATFFHTVSVSDKKKNLINEAVSGNGTVSGNGMAFWDVTVSGNATISGNDMIFWDETVSGNGTISGNSMAFRDETVSGNSTVSGNEAGAFVEPELTLEERRMLKSSYEETLAVNQEDREWITRNQYDFSGMKIACLGDSLTAAANLEKEENYESDSYPARLKELLGAETVYNLGIGGSSISRNWSDAFVDRYREIPGDADIIIVFGGVNDGFCVSQNEFGSLDERKYDTFCGDLDELMRGLRENYPDAVIFFATPLPNVLHDYLRNEREYLLPQEEFAKAIIELAKEYDFQLVDLYNSNILDSHDANVILAFLPDGVHGNQEGYRILAEHFAAKIIKYYAESE